MSWADRSAILGPLALPRGLLWVLASRLRAPLGRKNHAPIPRMRPTSPGDLAMWSFGPHCTASSGMEAGAPGGRPKIWGHPNARFTARRQIYATDVGMLRAAKLEPGRGFTLWRRALC
eukprot:6726341-Pyramimonas_sp.AAC.1